MLAPWRLRFESARLWLPVFLIVALAKGAAVFHGYSIDDYAQVVEKAPRASLMLAQGRFGQAAVTEAFYQLGLQPQHAGFFFAVLGIVASSLLGVAVVRFWKLRSADFHTLAAASFVAIHPFTTELFTFRTANGSSSVAFLLLAGALLLRPRTPRTVLAAAGLLALSLSIYQIVLNYAVIAILLGVAVGLTRWGMAAAHAGPKVPRLRRLLAPSRQLRSPNAALTAVVAVALAVYALGGWLVTHLTRVTATSRSVLITAADLDARARTVAQVIRERFLGPSPLVPDLTKQLLLLILLAALVGPLFQIRRDRRAVPLALLLANAILFAVAVVWTVGLALLLKEFWPAPRVMSQIGVFWAGAVAIAGLCCGRRVRMALGVVAGLVMLSFIGSDNRILHDQLRLNMRDLARANRELARLERLPGFNVRQTVALVGAPEPDQLPFATSDHDLNLSAFVAPWSKLGILREISGYDLKLPTDEGFAAAQGVCRDADRFPAERSILMKEEMAIVCLGPSP